MPHGPDGVYTSPIDRLACYPMALSTPTSFHRGRSYTMILIDPAYRPSSSAAPNVEIGRHLRDEADRDLFQTFADHKGAPVEIWTALDNVVRKRKPSGRAECRQFRRDLLDRLKRLRSLGILVSAGRGRMRIASVTKPTPESSGSHRRADPRRGARRRAKPTAPQLLTANSKGGTVSPITESVVARLLAKDRAIRIRSGHLLPSATDAGRNLRRLVGQPRKRTGQIDGKWIFRDQPIRLADGRVGYVYAVLRGRVAWNTEFGDRRSIMPGQCGVAQVKEVMIAKNPAAQALGSLKRGVTERHSKLKAASARANGCRLCRPGRKRGRPKSFHGNPSNLAAQ